MIHIAPFLTRSVAARTSELALDRHQVHERTSGSQLDQANVVLATFELTAENVAIKPEHAIEVLNPKHDVIDLADADTYGRISAAALRTNASSAHRARTVLRAQA